MTTTLKILLSSPSDVPDARKEAERRVESLNEDAEIASRYRLKVLKWEDAPPMVGREPQEIVNYYTGRAGQCDIVICIFGRRFGTEADVGGMLYPSGTYYEFLSAYRARRRNKTGRPVILLYRMRHERPPETPEDDEQGEKVEAFFNRFHGRDPTHLGLCKEYASAEDFGPELIAHLKQIILREFPRQKVEGWFRSLKRFITRKSNYAEAREGLIDEVRDMWIDKTLNDMAPPVAAAIRIKIRLIGGPSALTRPDSVPLPSDSDGSDARSLFDNASHQVVILGEPGAGKTFKMLELLSDLLRRAKEHDSVPIPVVFNLSSWADRGKPMADWLTDELTSVYGLSSEVARYWVDGEHLALLLDGLDEITAGGAGPGTELSEDAQSLARYCRRRCLDELNDYIADSAIWVVLCCRSAEYAALGTRLATRRVNSTAEIVPLTDAEVQTYLHEAGTELASLRQAIAVDDTLREMARTPFLLATMSTAYEEQPGMSAKEILEGGWGGREARLRDMFGQFVTTRHHRVAAWGEKLPSLLDIRYYLGELARKMEEGDTKLFFVDQLQPDHVWLSSAGRWAYRVLTAAFLFLFVCLLVGLPTGWAIGYELAGDVPRRLLSFDPWAALYSSLGCGGIVALGFLFTKNWGFGVACGLAFGLSRMIVVGMGRDRNGWGNQEPLSSLLRNRDSWLVVGLVSAAFGVLVLALIMRQRQHERDRIRPFEGQKWDARAAFFGTVLAVIVGLVFWATFDLTKGLAFGIALMIVLALTFGYQGVEVNIKTYPNQGIWQSGWNALLTVLLSAAAGMLCFGLAYWGTELGVVNAILGLTTGVVSLVFGAMPLMQHVSLRVVIERRNLAPLWLSDFLRAASAMQLMRRVGGGYMFLHEYLRAYFRELRREKSKRR